MVGAETGDISKPSNGGLLNSGLFVMISYCSFFLKLNKLYNVMLIAAELFIIYFLVISCMSWNVNAIYLNTSAGLLGLISFLVVVQIKNSGRMNKSNL
jgi:hypothetical protein